MKNRNGKRTTEIMSASVQNMREQRLLERHLNDIERLWFQQLRSMTTEKLDAVFDLTKLEMDKRTVEYFDQDLEGSVLKNFAEKTRNTSTKLKENGKHLEKFDFRTSDWVKSIKLPDIEKPVDVIKENVRQRQKTIGEKPKLYRSNSIVLQKSSSEENVCIPAESVLSRKNVKDSYHLSLPTLSNMDNTNKVRRAETEMRFRPLTMIRDCEEVDTPLTSQSMKRAGLRKGRLPVLHSEQLVRGYTTL